jgi:CRISPR-associated protein Csm4
MSDSGQKKYRKGNKTIEESLRISVQIDRNSFASADEKLYSYNPKFTRNDVSFVVLVKILDENTFDEFDCQNILKDTFTIGFGKKKSSGYGQFEVFNFDEFKGINEPLETTSFIVLGNYLPSKEDKVIPIGYDINTKYGKFGEAFALSENPFKNPIVFLISGSCFQTVNINKREYYGRVSEVGEISSTNSLAAQFGMPFHLFFNLT